MKNKFLIILTLITGAFGAYHEIKCYRMDGQQWGGEIVQKAYNPGTSSTFYFLMKDDVYGTYSISVHPLVYESKEVGNTHVDKFEYVPLIGLSGSAYRPDIETDNVLLILFKALFLSLLIIQLMPVILWRIR